MQRDGNTLEGRAGESPFFLAPSLEGFAEAQRVCDVQFLRSHQSQRDTDVQVFTGSSKGTRGVCVLGEVAPHRMNASLGAGTTTTLRYRLCWFMETGCINEFT